MTTPTQIQPALQLAVVEYGVITSPVASGGNTLGDTTKQWIVDVHKYRLLRVIPVAGAAQQAWIEGNAANTILIRGTWGTAIPIGSAYMILDLDVAEIIRNTLGGGVNVDIPAEFAALITALSVGLEASVDSGIATGGSNTTLADTAKNWVPGMWENSLVEVEIGGINYLRFTATPFNTATVVTIGALPGAIAVAAGCPYTIKRALHPLLPLEQALLHNVAGYLAAADMLAADLVPANTPCTFRVTGCFDAAGILSVETINGANPQVQRFNGGVPLNDNSLYMFEHLVHAGDAINYQYSVNATIMTFRVQEIVGAT